MCFPSLDEGGGTGCSPQPVLPQTYLHADRCENSNLLDLMVSLSCLCCLSSQWDGLGKKMNVLAKAIPIPKGFCFYFSFSGFHFCVQSNGTKARGSLRVKLNAMQDMGGFPLSVVFVLCCSCVPFKRPSQVIIWVCDPETERLWVCSPETIKIVMSRNYVPYHIISRTLIHVKP